MIGPIAHAQCGRSGWVLAAQLGAKSRRPEREERDRFVRPGAVALNKGDLYGIRHVLVALSQASIDEEQRSESLIRPGALESRDSESQQVGHQEVEKQLAPLIVQMLTNHLVTLWQG